MNNKNYYYDINSIMNFVFNGYDGNKNTEIVEVYGVNEDKSLELLNKQFNESKSDNNDSVSAIKYDFVKNLMATLLGIETTETMNFGEAMVFNSMLAEGFIKQC